MTDKVKKVSTAKGNDTAAAAAENTVLDRPTALLKLRENPNVIALRKTSIDVKPYGETSAAEVMTPILSLLGMAGFVITGAPTPYGTTEKQQAHYKYAIAPKVTETVSFLPVKKARDTSVKNKGLGKMPVPVFWEVLKNPAFQAQISFDTVEWTNPDGGIETMVLLNLGDDKRIPASIVPQTHMAEKTSWGTSDFVNYVLRDAVESFINEGGIVKSSYVAASKMSDAKREKMARSELGADNIAVPTNTARHHGTTHRVPVKKGERPVDVQAMVDAMLKTGTQQDDSDDEGSES